MNEPVSRYLSKNLADLRKSKSLTQAQLAKLSGLPRSTVTNMESGEANPSLANLVALSSALKIGIEELLAKPRKATELVRATDVPVQERLSGKARIFKLLPDKIRGLNIDRMELARGAYMPGHPHIKGTKEYLTVLDGEITVRMAEGEFVVHEGDVLAFEGDQPHTYQNSGSKIARAISVVIPID